MVKIPNKVSDSFMGVRISVILATLCILTLAVSAHGQSMYLENGENGGYIGASYFNEDDIWGIAGDFGYSIRGTFNLGFILKRSTLDDGDLTYTSITLFEGLSVLKPNSNSPLGISFIVGYESGSFSNDVLDQPGWDMTASGFSFGGKVYVRVVSDSGVEFYPYLGITHVTSKVEIEDFLGNYESEDSDTTPIQIGGSMLMNRSLILGAGVSVSDEVNTISASAGLLF